MTPDELLGKRKNDVHPWVQDQVEKALKCIAAHKDDFEINPDYTVKYRAVGDRRWKEHHEAVAAQLRKLGWDVTVLWGMPFLREVYYLGICRPSQDGTNTDLGLFSAAFDEMESW